MFKEHDPARGHPPAQCTYFQKVMNGKPSYIQAHILSKCKSISADKLTEYLKIIKHFSKDKTVTSQPISISSTTTSDVPPSMAPGDKIIQNFTKSSLHHFHSRLKK